MASTSKRRIKNPKHSSRVSPFPSSITNLSSIEPPASLLPSKTDFFKLVAVVSIAVSVAIGCSYVVNFFNRQSKPFCNSNTEFDYDISDVCDPCPSHGVCSEGKLECMNGYKVHGRSCVEDGDINEMAKNLYLCRGMGKVWVEGDGLWSSVDKDNATYVYVKQKARKIVGNLLETRDTSIGIKEFKCPDLLVEHYKPLCCSIRLWLLQHALLLVPISLLLIGCGLILHRVRRRHYLSVRAEELYEQVCDMLEETASISRSVNGEGEPWIVASWLRDHFLTPRERRDPFLWRKVEELVQEDSRLDRYPKILKGEPKVVWEWQVDGALNSSGKKNKVNIYKHKPSEESNIGSNQDHRRLKTGEPFKC